MIPVAPPAPRRRRWRRPRRRVEVSLIRSTLPEPETPVTQVNRPPAAGSRRPRPSGCCRGADDLELAPGRWRLRRSAGTAIGGARGTAPVSESGGRRSLGACPRRRPAAVHAGAGAHVDHVVGHADGVLVVLDHDHGVAEVAQVRSVSAGGRCRAGAGRWRLVEHVHDAGQAEPIWLASRMRWPRRPTGCRPSGRARGSRGPR